MKTSSFIISTLVASAAGVTIGMLFAPQKGSRTRRKISEKNHQYSDYLSDKFDDFVESMSHPLEDIEDETKRMAGKADKKVKKAVSEAKAELN